MKHEAKHLNTNYHLEYELDLSRKSVDTFSSNQISTPALKLTLKYREMGSASKTKIQCGFSDLI